MNISRIDIETTNHCNAKCPLCVRDMGLTQHYTLDWSVIERQIPKLVWQNAKEINFNGTTGDNIMHPDIENILLWTTKQTDGLIKVSTNASMRSTEWWANLGQQLQPHNHLITFALDGLESVHEIYRVNTKFEKVIENATAFIKNGGSAEWQFILFDHNSHQINDCRELSKKIGFQKFTVVYQDRFDLSGQKNNIKKYTGSLDNINNLDIRPSSNHMENISSKKSINCYSKQIGWISIYADGTVWPCCWLMGWHKVVLKNNYTLVKYHFDKILQLDQQEISLYHNDLDTILSKPIWQDKLTNSFASKPNPICLQQCGR